MDFAILADLRVNLKENEKRGKYLDLIRELKKTTLEHKGDTTCNWCARYSHQRIGKSLKDLEIRGQVEY